ncbi:MAG: 1-acyl-sn-glycerol-3-phosphate acyltransferase [Clostridia bacterium]|nr:1-acyl-sn-glycerol-3-phosphate acyltransferase [Clostridia bacterium]
MKTVLSAIGGAFVRFGFSLLCLWLRILYRPRLQFEGEHGKELLRGPAVVISNHKTHIDGGLLPLALGRRHIVTFVARDWYEKKQFRHFFRHLPYMPMDRKEMDTAWLEQGLSALDRGKAVLIFPEGRTEKEGVLNPFHPGFALLARRANVPVVPVALPTAYRKFRRNIIKVGEPFAVSTEKGQRASLVCRAAAADAENRIRHLTGEPLPATAQTPVMISK